MKAPSDRGGPSLPAGTLLKQFLQRHPAFSANPIGDWKELVGEQIARYTRPRSLKQRVLVIAAHDSVWKHHLEQLKEVLAEKINGKRPEPIVEQIVIKVAQIPEAAELVNPAHKELQKLKGRKPALRKKPKTPVRKLTGEEQLLLKGVSDPELRNLGAKLLKRIPLEDETDGKERGK
ncbi:MAG: DUF721 domain-containing protein [Desulfobacteraceae bacterium]|nr:DUF721 domain-containing protein [Desulfobacteraceae bacterium]